MPKCEVEGCEKPKHGKLYCGMHHNRWKRHGDPLAGRRFNGMENNCGHHKECPANNRLKCFLWAEKNKDLRRSISKRHYEANKDAYISRAIAQQDELKREYRKRWREKNGAKVKAATLSRKRGLKQATPEWLTEEQFQEMNAIYAECRRISEETGIPHHVDHIVPLRGKTAMGLHVPQNLRIIPADQNMRRSRTWRGTDDLKEAANAD